MLQWQMDIYVEMIQLNSYFSCQAEYYSTEYSISTNAQYGTAKIFLTAKL